MDPSYLATKLASALAEIVPDGFRVYEEQGMVVIDDGRVRAASEVAEIIDQPGDIMRLAETVSENALSHVQDYIAEALTTPWPNERGQLPAPKVRVTKDRIELWLEASHGERVLEVPTIPW